MELKGLSALLVGLEPAVARELSHYLAGRGMAVRVAGSPGEMDGHDVVFCSAREKWFPDVLRGASCPVVAVSRLPETEEWLEVIEAGAADYCAAPIEREQMDWILESNLGGKAKASAA
ncbi:MAG: response regulator [Bryobacter sp.]|jgi:DNA-binding response OmpR family regulator|nr:response regulator [Bryobacter sp. CoA8 C33]